MLDHNLICIFSLFDTASNIAPPKSVFRSGTSSKNTAKSMLSGSPLPSPPEQPGPGTSASPLGTGTSLRGDSNHEDTTVPSHVKKERASNEKEMPSKMAHGAKKGSRGHIMGNGDQPTDLRSMLITLLSDCPKGMSLKVRMCYLCHAVIYCYRMMLASFGIYLHLLRYSVALKK